MVVKYDRDAGRKAGADRPKSQLLKSAACTFPLVGPAAAHAPTARHAPALQIKTAGAKAWSVPMQMSNAARLMHRQPIKIQDFLLPRQLLISLTQKWQPENMESQCDPLHNRSTGWQWNVAARGFAME
jgi:hypothetical protein